LLFTLYSIHEDFYQKLWLTKTDWDSPIPQQLTEDWLKFPKAFNAINYLTVPRWVILTADNTVELHGFADASSLAYAAAIYCRQKHNSKIKVQLLVSKTKVAPVKQVSIPRLELCKNGKKFAEIQNILPQLMGNLPKHRVTLERPFFSCGIDYAGPVLIKCNKVEGLNLQKGYIALLVCLATKAVHITAVGDLTDSFIAALRRF
ncbi:uncharacterized protein TNCV_2726881, partial [Trichonephila clavipes]